ncbi:MAG: urea ABC transporter permease subunit UrtB [Hyphomicrobiaceae bacterium]|nr:urea ABC transporter permease subunit UrtB [Hyphomicrobiaceae bacterium]
MGLLGPGPGEAGLRGARAQALDEALAKLAADNFSDTAKAIDEIAASGSPSAVAILEALADRRMLVSPETKAVILKTADGKLTDARSGKPMASAPADVAPARINNRLRGAVDAALGKLVLVSPDPAKRIVAAEAIFKSRKASDLGALDQALAREKDSSVRAAFVKARAAIMLSEARSPLRERIAAVVELQRWPDTETLGFLRQIQSSAAEPEVREAADAAITRIEHHRQLLSGVQTVVYGLSLGSVLLLAAIGLAITFGVMGVINMAHGEMVMLGAYTTFVVQEAFRAWAPGAFDLSLPVAIPLAFAVAGAVGIAIERGIIRFLYGRPLETLLATWGVSLVLQQAVRTAFGPTNREVGNPSYMSGAFDLYGVSITWSRLWIIVFTLAVFVALQLVLRKTRLGLEMRAVTQNRRMAASMGIRSARVDALTFGLGSGIAGIAGVALSQIDNVSPNLGQSYIVDSFMVVVFGGVGNLWGTLVSAFFLGIANKMLEPVAGAVLAKILILVLLILFIQKRPRGLFALKGRAVEA